MAFAAVGIGNGSLVNGRAFARNGALTLDNNQFYSSPPTLAIDGGDSAYTTGTTPTISGTTDLEAPGAVTVTLGGQTFTTSPTGGKWSVSSAILANGTYPVVASVTDAVGNRERITQQLTVDTVLPVVTIEGRPSITTSDRTPTISGTSDAEVGTVVRVTVGSQTLRALVNPKDTWNIRPTALPDGTYEVNAAVRDPAGNEGTDSQALTVDTAGPGGGDGDPEIPETTITKDPRARTDARKVKYQFVSDEPRASFECKLDKRSFNPCTSPRKLKVEQGKHTFSVRAIDVDGNVDPTAAEDRFRVVG